MYLLVQIGIIYRLIYTSSHKQPAGARVRVSEHLTELKQKEISFKKRSNELILEFYD